MTEILDLFSILERKDAVLKQVSDNAGSWMDDVLAAAAQLAVERQGEIVTGEGVRALVEPLIGPPGHHNAWGAAISNLVRKRYLIQTGRWVPMRAAKSNGRRTPEYRLTVPGAQEAA